MHCILPNPTLIYQLVWEGEVYIIGWNMTYLYTASSTLGGCREFKWCRFTDHVVHGWIFQMSVWRDGNVSRGKFLPLYHTHSNSLYLSLSVCLSVYVCLCLSLSLSLSLFIYSILTLLLYIFYTLVSILSYDSLDFLSLSILPSVICLSFNFFIRTALLFFFLSPISPSTSLSIILYHYDTVLLTSIDQPTTLQWSCFACILFPFASLLNRCCFKDACTCSSILLKYDGSS